MTLNIIILEPDSRLAKKNREDHKKFIEEVSKAAGVKGKDDGSLEGIIFDENMNVEGMREGD